MYELTASGQIETTALSTLNDSMNDSLKSPRTKSPRDKSPRNKSPSTNKSPKPKSPVGKKSMAPSSTAAAVAATAAAANAKKGKKTPDSENGRKYVTSAPLVYRAICTSN
jgi:hypothetical protein